MNANYLEKDYEFRGFDLFYDFHTCKKVAHRKRQSLEIANYTSDRNQWLRIRELVIGVQDTKKNEAGNLT